MAADPLSALQTGLQHMFWTRVIPFGILAILFGIGVKSFERWVLKKAGKLGKQRRAKANQQKREQSSSDTPNCPLCGESMVLRISKKRSNSGNQFWGCPSFPRCRGTAELI